jgi:hypothetical protein
MKRRAETREKKPMIIREIRRHNEMDVYKKMHRTL